MSARVMVLEDGVIEGIVERAVRRALETLTPDANGCHGPGLACSFCGRTQREARVLIAGPCVYICEECIETAHAHLTRHDAEASGPAVVEGDSISWGDHVAAVNGAGDELYRGTVMGFEGNLARVRTDEGKELPAPLEHLRKLAPAPAEVSRG